jgi:phytoene desaturase (3,4-didehydrolycopene-forming)
MVSKQHIVIVGAGAGGLAAAAHLASAGLRVTVLEKNSRPGGRCARIERDGHTFEIGPTLLVMPGLYELEFAALGVRLRERLTMRRVDPTYHLHFDDGARLDLTSDLERMRTQLEAIEPGSFGPFLRYLEEGGRHYALATEGLVRRNFRSLTEFLTPSNIPLFLRVHALHNHYRRLGRFFRTERLKNSLSFQDMYMGISPFDAMATFSMLQYTELAEGVWYPEGGMTRLTDALYDLAVERGADVRLGAPVAQIEIQGGRAVGVRMADGDRVSADIVLANADLPYVYAKLLPDAVPARRLERKTYSCSTISFLWGVDRIVPELDAHTLFLSDDFRANFDDILKRKTISANPSVYFHAPARLDSRMAPTGMDTLLAIVPVGHLDPRAGQDWPAITQHARLAALRRLASLGVTDLEAHLRLEIIIDPAEWQSGFNLVRGATHGLAHTLLQMGWFRPHNRHARYRNLYFAGASTHPGTGLPTAIVSGRLAAERVLEDLPYRI